MCARHVRETKVAGARVTMMAALFAFVAITRTRGGCPYVVVNDILGCDGL